MVFSELVSHIEGLNVYADGQDVTSVYDIVNQTETNVTRVIFNMSSTTDGIKTLHVSYSKAYDLLGMYNLCITHHIHFYVNLSLSLSLSLSLTHSLTLSDYQQVIQHLFLLIERFDGFEIRYRQRLHQ